MKDWMTEEPSVTDPVRHGSGVGRKNRSGDNVCLKLTLRPKKLVEPCGSREFIVVDKRKKVRVGHFSNSAITCTRNSSNRLAKIANAPWVSLDFAHVFSGA